MDSKKSYSRWRSGVPRKPAIFLHAGALSRSHVRALVLGMGFVLTPEEAQALIDKNPKNRDVLFPYLNGQDLNSRPDQSPSRWVINFRDWPLDRGSAPQGYAGPVAADYPECLAIVEAKVKPERERRKPDGSFQLRRPLPQRWWQYGEKRPALYAAIVGMKRVLVRALTGKHNAFAFMTPGIVFDQTAPVLTFDNDETFALLTSSLHACWWLAHGPSLRTDPRYTPTDCFETFPFPKETALLRDVGHRYAELRARITRQRSEGLTATYNRFHDPDEHGQEISELRALHVELDAAVASCFGWPEIALGHGFVPTSHGVRYIISDSARREVLDRLLALNHERYAEEAKNGLHDSARPKKTSSSSSKPRSRRSSLQEAPRHVTQTGFTFADAPTRNDNGAGGGRTEAPTRLSPPAQALASALRAAAEPLTKHAWLALAGIATTQWTAGIRELRAAGLVDQIGERPNATYVASREAE
jgi:hypothetical protein